MSKSWSKQLEFPPYSLSWHKISDTIVVAGGGGSTKSGFKNGLIFIDAKSHQITHNHYTNDLAVNSVHFFPTQNAILKQIYHDEDKHTSTIDITLSQLQSTLSTKPFFMAAGVGNNCEIFKYSPSVESDAFSVSHSPQQVKPLASSSSSASTPLARSSSENSLSSTSASDDEIVDKLTFIESIVIDPNLDPKENLLRISHFCPSGQHLFCSGDGKKLKYFEFPDLKLWHRQLPKFPDVVWSVSVNPENNEFVAVVSKDNGGTLRLFNVATGNRTMLVKPPKQLQKYSKISFRSVSFSTCGNYLFAAINVLAVKGKRKIWYGYLAKYQFFEYEARIESQNSLILKLCSWRTSNSCIVKIAISPNNYYLGACTSDGSIEVYRSVHFRRVMCKSKIHKQVVTDIVFSPNSRSIASIGPSDRTLKITVIKRQRDPLSLLINLCFLMLSTFLLVSYLFPEETMKFLDFIDGSTDIFSSSSNIHLNE